MRTNVLSVRDPIILYRNINTERIAENNTKILFGGIFNNNAINNAQ